MNCAQDLAWAMLELKYNKYKYQLVELMRRKRGTFCSACECYCCMWYVVVCGSWCFCSCSCSCSYIWCLGMFSLAASSVSVAAWTWQCPQNSRRSQHASSRRPLPAATRINFQRSQTQSCKYSTSLTSLPHPAHERATPTAPARRMQQQSCNQKDKADSGHRKWMH